MFAKIRIIVFSVLVARGSDVDVGILDQTIGGKDSGGSACAGFAVQSKTNVSTTVDIYRLKTKIKLNFGLCPPQLQHNNTTKASAVVTTIASVYYDRV